jgi:metallo-beta-lactamase family protein
MAFVKWHFLGGIRTVTGSCHVLEVDGQRLLLDCGLFQGRRKEANRRNRHLPLDVASVTRAMLGHAHIDHCGSFPTLVKQGFHGSIYATHATRDLLSLMLRDSAHIQRRDAEWVNKREKRRGADRIEPLYDEHDVDATLALLCGRPYHKPFFPLPGVRATLVPAGHILGSALTLLEVELAGRTLRIAYVVDLGRSHRTLLKDPVQLSDLDVLIIESTYGNREHEDRDGAQERLARVINETCERDGKIIIPAFALGRTQEIVRSIAYLQEAGTVAEIPIFVDSPLAIDISAVFALHSEEFDREASRQLVAGGDPLGSRRVTYTRSVEESKQLNQRKGPCVIISSSGMCEAGRILHHLRNAIEDPRNTVAIVGYQAPRTLGRRLVERRDEVRIFGESFKRRARVELLNAYSAHADRSDLLDYIEKAGRKLRAVYLVHGEPEQQEALYGELSRRGLANVQCPETESSVELD